MNVINDKVVFFTLKDLFWLASVVLLLVVLMTIDKPLINPQKHYQILINDSLVGVFPFSLDTTIILQGNEGGLQVGCYDSIVRIFETSCRHRICTHQKVDALGKGEIVCLPNKLVVSPVCKPDEDSLDYIVR